MPPRQRIIAIRLTDKLHKNPHYAERLGVEIQQVKVVKPEQSEEKK